MLKNNEKYPIETALEKLIIEIRRAVKRFSIFFTTIPDRKGERMVWTFETLAWLFLTLTLILRFTGWR
jgi:hypothetical protein